jgi:hypothetical protein
LISYQVLDVRSYRIKKRYQNWNFDGSKSMVVLEKSME